MDNWEDLKLLLALSRYKTMTASAYILGISTATVSRRLERLTDELGETLFVRRGSELETTQSAKRLITIADQLDTDLWASQKADNTEHIASRRLRISISMLTIMSIDIHHFGDLLTDKSLKMDLYEDKRSVAFGEVDIAVSSEEPTEGRLVRTQIGKIDFGVYIHEDWSMDPTGFIALTKFGTNYEEMPYSVVLEDRFGPPRVVTSGLCFAISLAKAMPFALCLPDKLARRYPELVPLSDDLATEHCTVWAAYHENRRLDPEIRLGIDFLKKSFLN